MKDSITKEKLFNHSIETIWNAISIGEEISTWFIKADFKAEKGYKYTFTASEDKGCLTITGEVKEANPYTLIYTWIVENTTVETTVKWSLEPISKNETKLYLEHSGISNYAGDTAIAMFESFSGGWDGCINGLIDYLKTEVNAG
ncbi:SRPBCC domain-containing protein [uncultured Lacinutrix sp.]|uniref:SRPBCC family protein n=1 Tax=uncultured Lacinutrix sp. TaxID=574032 RepID=UPI00260418B8|nr:SRPBCC domain-containing protein [uncultured Lacinutrix sp.]